MDLIKYKNGTFNYEFRGSLSGVKFSHWNEELAEHLIKNKILVLSEQYLSVDDEKIYIGDCSNMSDSIQFEETTYYKGKQYHINPVLTTELFFYLESFIRAGHHIQELIERIFFKSNSFLGKNKKIKYLQKNYKKHFPKDEDFGFFSTIVCDECDERDVRDEFTFHNCWYHFAQDYLLGSDGLLLHEYYLTENTEEGNSSKFNHLISSIFNEAQQKRRDFQLNKKKWSAFLNREDFENDLGFLIYKWNLFYEKEIILRDISDEIEKLEMDKPDTIDNTESSEKSKLYNLNVLSNLEVAYFAYYMKEAKENFIPERFPSEAGYQFLGDKYGPNWKNIQQSYLEIKKDRDKRLTESRYKIIEKIMPLLSPKALSIAEHELISI